MTEHFLRFAAAVWFLPLFPFSGLFVNLLGRKVRSSPLRASLYLIWPLIGVLLLGQPGSSIPGWLGLWVWLSAALYALRLLATRDLRLWSAYLGASSYALLWLLNQAASPWMAALALGIPLAIMTFLVGALEQRFGAAYSGLYGRLHFNQPYLAGTLTLVTLAVVATPIFPGFFVLTGIAFHSSLVTAAAVLVVWVVWTWAAILLLQGFMLGPVQLHSVPADLPQQTLYSLASTLALFVIAGLLLSTHLLQ